ncbi:MAG: hypothetical protein QME12_08945 [Nanoarchaeota archaeon]|nr:hypothetical protein [Nanoarchaeota archaeon]
MKESSWDDCIFGNKAVKVSPDTQKAKSLLETARERIEFAKAIAITERNARFVFEDYYTSLIEVVHALAILDGFKIENHVCLGFYIKEIQKSEKLFLLFDSCRYARNSVVYYGKSMEMEAAKINIGKAIVIINELGKIVDLRLKK